MFILQVMPGSPSRTVSGGVFPRQVCVLVDSGTALPGFGSWWFPPLEKLRTAPDYLQSKVEEQRRMHLKHLAQDLTQ